MPVDGDEAESSAKGKRCPSASKSLRRKKQRVKNRKEKGEENLDHEKP